MAIVVNLEDASKFFGGMSEAMLRAARNGLLLSAERGVQKIVVEIIPKRSPQPVDRGVYKAGWKSERIDRNTVAIMNPEAHAVFIEYGVRAENVKIGAAMIRALAEWAMRKGIVADEKQSIGVAWAIAKTMQRKGVFNRRSGNGLRIAEELNEQYLDDIVREEISREMQNAADRQR